MMRAVTASAFCAAILAGQALAGDLDYYPKAPAGSAYYGPASMVTAQVDIAGGLAFASGDASGAAGVLSGAGRANMQLRGPWNLQVDVYGQSVSMYDFLDANAVNLNHMNFGAAAYLYHRDGTTAFGPFVAIERRGSSPYEWAKSFGFGWAPQYGPWEVHAYGHVSWLTDGINNGAGIGGQVGVQYWLDRNTYIGGDVALNNFSNGGLNFSVLTGALTALHRFDYTPYAVFGQARVDNTTGDGNATVWSLQVGGRFYANPGAGDAAADAESGPAFTTRLPLPFRM